MIDKSIGNILISFIKIFNFESIILKYRVIDGQTFDSLQEELVFLS